MGKSIIFFSASWCKSCQSIKHDVLAIRSRLDLGRSSDGHDDRTKPPQLVYIDVDEDPGASDAHDVKILPCFVFIDQHDQSVFRYEGSDLHRINTYIDSFVLDDKSFELQLAAEDDDASIEASNPIVYPKLCGVRLDSLIFSVDDIDSLYNDGCKRNHKAAHDILVAELSAVEIAASVFDQSLQQLSDDRNLFEFIVPTLSKDGTCSNSAVLSPHPFNLATVVYGLKASDQFEYQKRRTYLTKLHRIVALIHEVSNHAEWIGIYRLLQVDDKHFDSIRNGGLIDGDRVLVKEAYRGLHP